MSDYIDRQAAIDAFAHKWDGMVTSVFDVIDEMPSAEPDASKCWGCNCPKMETKAERTPITLHVNKITDHKSDFSELDAEPVRMKGKWVTVRDPIFADTYYCSVCREEPLATDTEWVLSKFCPNCGAMMSEGEEDEP